MNKVPLTNLANPGSWFKVPVFWGSLHSCTSLSQPKNQLPRWGGFFSFRIKGKTDITFCKWRECNAQRVLRGTPCSLKDGEKKPVQKQETYTLFWAWAWDPQDLQVLRTFYTKSCQGRISSCYPALGESQTSPVQNFLYIISFKRGVSSSCF